MIVIFGIVLLLVLIAWFYAVTQPPKEAAPVFGSSTSAAESGIGVAYFANGNLFYREAGGTLTQLHSPYVQQIADRIERSKERHAWKNGTSFNVSASGQMRQFATDGGQIQVTSAQFHDNKLFYFLRDEGIGGLFSFDLDSGVETRILHRQHLDLADLCLDRDNGKFVCSAASKDSATNIATLDTDGNQYRELTGGDTADAAPSWGPDNTILYQSSGLARNQAGFIVAQAHSTIQRLNLRSGTIDCVLDDSRYDFLHPRVTQGGDLLFIRRPHEEPSYRPENVALDVLLFPFRLVRAVFHYLNFFSLMYSRKPLTGASGPAMQADIKDIILKGKRIDAEKALRKEAPVAGIASLVPSSWQLVRRDRQGNDKILANNVASYDLGPDGSIVFSNGRAVFRCQDDGRATLVLKGDLVAEVIAR